MAEVQAALAPVLGSRGFALIYRRGLYLSASLRPMLASTPDQALQDAPATPDFDALRALIAQHDRGDAMASATALLQTIHDLLVTLVGLSLTDRLLGSVRANHSSGSPAPDGPS
ncbi:hypothetical protein QFW77_11595 [Luteimonas sp. RD2P54]|uniref:Uncharacterized protein n=1 Tax=Luteimonas endophytica TaxID=3042023 RepID=A0ABT6J9X7_9GAMM|nr:hypothetical protein [Luteimonas endophytica]MDH5823631.1 hypothetical protein [Luteimonas endophytica]